MYSQHITSCNGGKSGAYSRYKQGQTIDFLLTKERDEQAAKRFLTKAIRRHGVPEKITIDGSAANEAAIKSYNAEHGTAIEIRKIKYLNNIVEQDHRGVTRVTRPMLGFKSFAAAQDTLVGIELMHMRDCLMPQLLELTVFGVMLLAPSVRVPTSHRWGG